MDDQLPLVSVVTPSYNKGPFIEETILSVRNQTYPRIEHIVIDGGSTDGTLEVLRKYDDCLTWISEPDNGQADAVNKGWRMAKGEILGWLNADDTYVPSAVETAVRALCDNPDAGMIYGQCSIIDGSGRVTGQYTQEEFDLTKLIYCWCMVPQPAVFMRRSVLDEIGYLDANLYMAMDLDMWIRIGLKSRVQYVPQLLANFRICPGTKSVDEQSKNTNDYLYILDKLFSSTGLPRNVRTVKRKAYRSLHLASGFRDHAARDMSSARRHFVAALWLQPQFILKDRWVLGYLISAILGSRVTDLVVRWKRRIRGKVGNGARPAI